MIAGPHKREAEGQSQRAKAVGWRTRRLEGCTLKTEEGARSQGVQAASNRRKKARNCALLPRPFGRNQFCRHLGFGRVKLVLDSWPPDPEENSSVLFLAIRPVAMCPNSSRRLIQRVTYSLCLSSVFGETGINDSIDLRPSCPDNSM